MNVLRKILRNSIFKKIFIQLKKIFIIIDTFVSPIKNSKFAIIFIRKPLNTWILSKLPYTKSSLKESKIWMDQSLFKISWYDNDSGEYDREYISYILFETSKNDSILDICCNRGRHLKALHKNGYRNLLGVDIMNDAILDLQNSPEYKSGGITSETNFLQEYILSMKDKSLDYAITYSASIELTHPSFDIFKELYRVTRKGFIFMLDENGHAFPRFYRNQIKSNKFILKNIQKYGKSLTLIHAVKN